MHHAEVEHGIRMVILGCLFIPYPRLSKVTVAPELLIQQTKVELCGLKVSPLIPHSGLSKVTVTSESVIQLAKVEHRLVIASIGCFFIPYPRLLKVTAPPKILI
ncbi:hypothetical protein D3C80_1110860 [compost metagenome]